MAKPPIQNKPVRRRLPVRPEASPDGRQTKKQIAHGRREARQQRIIFLSLAAFALVILTIIAVGVIREVAVKPRGAVAIVDGTKIRRADFDAQVAYQRSNLTANIQAYQDTLNGLDPADENDQFMITLYQQQIDQLQAQLATVESSALDQLIDDALIGAKAEEENLSVSREEIQQAITDDLKQAFEGSTQTPITTTQDLPTATPVPQSAIDSLYDNFLSSLDISDDQFRAIVRRSLTRQKLQEQLASEVPTTGLVVHVQMIVTSTQEIAAAAEARIKAGEDFAAVAKEVSSDAQVETNGGDIGWLALGQANRRYGQAFEDWAFAQELGALAVVESNSQFYVVKLLERDENGALPSDELSYRQSNALTDWLAARKASPDVKIERLLDLAQANATAAP